MDRTPLEELVDACVERHGAHTIDVVLKGRHQRPVLEVYVDAEAGVTTELCSAISRDINAALRTQPALDTLSQLTVSSPGIDRPLVFPWQYRKHVGRDLTVRQTIEGGGEEEVLGRLTAVGDDALLLETAQPAGERRIPFSAIVRAVVNSPW
jgi:ribosome maturation factor RimP